MKTKQAPQTFNIVREEWISLTDSHALLLANDKLNDDFAGQYVAYLDRRRGNNLHRRVFAHSRRLGAIHQALDGLPKGLQKSVVVHYAGKSQPDAVDVHFDLPDRV